MTHALEIHYHPDGEWAALYQDGMLVNGTVGDSYLAVEKALSICEVASVHESDFLLGGRSRSDAASTVEEITNYRDGLSRKQKKAERLRAEAAALLDEAEELEKS